MHNRRVVLVARPSAGVLPLYSSGGGASLVGSPDPIDTLRNKDRTLHLRYRFHPTTNQLSTLCKSILFAAAVFLLCMYISHDVPIQEDEEADKVFTTLSGRQLLVNEFPSLKYPLEHSTLVGLYFAASWCPQSTPVTNELDKLFQNIILKPPPPTIISNDLNATTANKLADFSIVYVSSDNNLDSMERYIKPNWFYVPFDNVVERSLLKERFKTCAKKELPVLGFTREHEIPTLVIFSSELGDGITYNGIDDVADLGVNAIHHWLEMEQTRKLSLVKK